MKVKSVTVSNKSSGRSDLNRILESQTGISITAEIEEGDNVEEKIKSLQIDCEVAIAAHLQLIKDNREVLERALQDRAKMHAEAMAWARMEIARLSNSWGLTAAEQAALTGTAVHIFKNCKGDRGQASTDLLATISALRQGQAQIAQQQFGARSGQHAQTSNTTNAAQQMAASQAALQNAAHPLAGLPGPITRTLPQAIVDLFKK